VIQALDVRDVYEVPLMFNAQHLDETILRLLGGKERQLLTLDEHRRAIEELGPGAYDELSYYERWISAITNILIEKGVISIDELGRKMEAVKARWAEASQ